MTILSGARHLTLALCLATVEAHAAPIFGTELQSFAVLAGAAVTNTGVTLLTGGLGVANNSSLTGITGFVGSLANDGPGIATGPIRQGDAYGALAMGQVSVAKGSLALMGPGIVLAPDLAGLTLTPGIYTVPAGASNLTGALTLDGLGNANAVWVFQFPSTLITSPGAAVDVINTGTGAGVFWNVGSSATLDTNTRFGGNILASASVTMASGVNLFCGRALAETGAVTLIANSVDADTCLGTGEEGSKGLSGGLTVPDGTYGSVDNGSGTVIGGVPVVPGVLPFAPVTAIPEPQAWALLTAGLLVLITLVRRKRVATGDRVSLDRLTSSPVP